jgi:hypothetical protein
MEICSTRDDGELKIKNNAQRHSPRPIAEWPIAENSANRSLLAWNGGVGHFFFSYSKPMPCIEQISVSSQYSEIIWLFLDQ